MESVTKHQKELKAERLPSDVAMTPEEIKSEMAAREQQCRDRINPILMEFDCYFISQRIESGAGNNISLEFRTAIKANPPKQLQVSVDPNIGK